MTNTDSRVPIEQLPTAIEALLKSGPRVIDAIARELGYSVSAIRPRIEQLQLENRVHRRRVKFQHWSGVCYAWHCGAAIDAQFAPDGAPAQVRAEDQGIVPSQHSIRAYPAIGRRAPLVAALFGPVRQAGA